MKFLAILTAVCLWKATANAHMSLSYPLPFRSPQNPNTPSGKADYSMTSPLKSDGSDFPCKGYQVDFGTPAGASVATWVAGDKYNFTVVGGAPHSGGSCQASLSYDRGKSFTVIQSIIGNCPLATGDSFSVNVPSDANTGAAIFAWTWFNKVGNREMYMNCASITIKESIDNVAPKQPFSQRPSILVANLGNGCTTAPSKDVIFPNPGPDSIDVSTDSADVQGTCKAVNGISDSSSSPSMPPGSTSSQTVGPFVGITVSSFLALSTAPSGFITVTASGSSTPLTASGSSTVTLMTVPVGTSTGTSPALTTGALKQSTDGSCGNGITCSGLALGGCCSQYGWCGSSDLHCGVGCQAAFGNCNGAGANSAATQSSSATSSGDTATSLIGTATSSNGTTTSSTSSTTSSSSSTTNLSSSMTSSASSTTSSSSSSNSTSTSSRTINTFIPITITIPTKTPVPRS